jgi:two-component system sensor histidine kinase AlgZ
VLVARMEHAPASWPAVFLQVFLSFVPWMLATPALLRFGQRFPISETGTLRSLALHAGIGVIVVPALAACGVLLNALLLPLPPEATLARMLGGSMITALYSAPTYVAVVGIGQALAYLERYRTRERLLARAQLQALQAQIHPHFLFNALNAISALGYTDPTRADRALSELSALLRLSFKDGPEEIPLKDEIAFVQGCVDVYALLMPERLDWRMEIDPEAWSARVPRMILQPLVENAVVHGIARRKQGGEIALHGQVQNGELLLSLQNDDAESGTAQSGNGVGLNNVRERLRVLYGPAQELALTCEPGGRTCVTLRLPYLRGETPA